MGNNSPSTTEGEAVSPIPVLFLGNIGDVLQAANKFSTQESNIIGKDMKSSTTQGTFVHN
jgi:hypothetical protein